MRTDPIAVPEHRRTAIFALMAALGDAKRVALSTHMNSDGDGCGSEAALALLLAQRGITAHIVNPTPWPAMYHWLLTDGVKDRTHEGAKALKGIDRLIVLDISDVKRLGVLTETVRALTPAPLTIDHHLPSDEPPGTVFVTDTKACATGELIWDVASVLELEITPEIATALYTALLTDTGGFRFSNTSPRCLAIASRLLAAGVNPEEMYRRIYASVPKGRLGLLRDALGTLGTDDTLGLAWVSVAAGALEQYNVTGEDLEGIAEYPRSIIGVRLALLFRDLGHGKVKISFRSAGNVDANALAKQFGGGGHAKASGALVAGTLAEVQAQVIAAAKVHLTAAGPR
jgi:phosphoesterase RecJ-like protein